MKVTLTWEGEEIKMLVDRPNDMTNAEATEAVITMLNIVIQDLVDAPLVDEEEV